MDRAVIDHRGPELPEITLEVVASLRRVFGTAAGRVALWAGSGTGAWEAAVVNTLNPGDRVLAFNNGIFAEKFAEVATKFGLEVDLVEMRWGDAVSPEIVASKLNGHAAVQVVHNETSTGVTSDLAGIRKSMDASGQDPLLLVDTVSSLGSMDFRFDEWRVDVALTGSQKGLMLPPGMAICCVSPGCRREDSPLHRRSILSPRPKAQFEVTSSAIARKPIPTTPGLQPNLSSTSAN